MKQTEKNLEFLKKLNAKTIEFYESTRTPNISGSPQRVRMYRFKNHVVSKITLDRVLKIVEEELLFIYPKKSLGGYSIEGYEIRDLNGEILFAFSKKNLHPGANLKEIFNFCQTPQNNLILTELKKEKKFFGGPVRGTFENF
jgi:hypothetical protein